MYENSSNKEYNNKTTAEQECNRLNAHNNEFAEEQVKKLLALRKSPFNRFGTVMAHGDGKKKDDVAIRELFDYKIKISAKESYYEYAVHEDKHYRKEYVGGSYHGSVDSNGNVTVRQDYSKEDVYDHSTFTLTPIGKSIRKREYIKVVTDENADKVAALEHKLINDNKDLPLLADTYMKSKRCAYVLPLLHLIFSALFILSVLCANIFSISYMNTIGIARGNNDPNATKVFFDYHLWKLFFDYDSANVNYMYVALAVSVVSYVAALLISRVLDKKYLNIGSAPIFLGATATMICTGVQFAMIFLLKIVDFPPLSAMCILPGLPRLLSLLGLILFTGITLMNIATLYIFDIRDAKRRKAFSKDAKFIAAKPMIEKIKSFTVVIPKKELKQIKKIRY